MRVNPAGVPKRKTTDNLASGRLSQAAKKTLIKLQKRTQSAFCGKLFMQRFAGPPTGDEGNLTEPKSTYKLLCGGGSRPERGDKKKEFTYKWNQYEQALLHF